jgi:excisionase family DNA binding protein
VLQARAGGPTSPRLAPRLLKVGEVAERLGVSTATVYALCKRGALQHVRVGNAIRVPEAALAALLD